MTESPALTPEWDEAAARAGTELGLGTRFAGMTAAAWERICGRIAETRSARGAALPPGWEAALARRVGRPEIGRPEVGSVDPDALARDEADAVLAAQGEVFAPENDA